MTQRLSIDRRFLPMLAVLAAVTIAACGGDSDGGGGGAEPTATQARPPSPTATPLAAQSARGLVVLGTDVPAGAGDSLGVPPSEWSGPGYDQSFDRSLSHADLEVRGVPGAVVETGADGQFFLPDLPPGRYMIDLTKTLGGNLIVTTIPVVVGDGGDTTIVVQISRGGARTVIEYEVDGVLIREVHGAYGNRLVTRDGRISELSDGGRTFVDADGDGRFEASSGCTTGNLSVCQFGDAACGDGNVCQCAASCPFCEDCRGSVCAPPGMRGSPYACNPDGTCPQPGDRCACVASCPDCDDCLQQLCVPACGDVQIAGVNVNGPAQLIVGRQAYVSATVRFSDGTTMDVTQLVDWILSDPAVARLDSWGSFDSLTVGVTEITATLGDRQSPSFRLEVTERPALRRIFLNNISCHYPYDYAAGDVSGAPSTLPPDRGDILPVPYCGQVVRIGATLHFAAIGEFGEGLEYQDISDEVTWNVAPANLGSVDTGLFTALAEGEGQISASLGSVSSDSSTVRVVSQPTIVSLSIYADNYAYPAIDGGPARPGADAWCPECGFGMTILRGDTVKFRATAQYDTGEWEDVSSRVSWRTSDAAAATIDSDGTLDAVAAGSARIDAVLGEVTSNPVEVRVVNEATLQYLSIYPEGTDRVVARGDVLYFRAWGSYDVGISRDVTTEAIWKTSDDSIGGFDTPAVFTGRAAGVVQVWAELGGQRSESFSIEVYATGSLDYCDPENVNRGVWSDPFNRVTLESDCAEYSQPGVVELRYTVTETQPHGGIFDPCLDLYVYDGDRRIRTLREEGCGEPFLAPNAPGADEAALKYQLLAFWDLKDERGDPVPPGVYTVYGRFYLYYDPIVQIDVVVLGDDAALPDLVPLRANVVSPDLPGDCIDDPTNFRISMDVCLANQGEGPARSSLLRVGGTTNAAPTELRIAGLRAGQQRCVNLPFIPFQVDVSVDAAKEVQETNEANNEASYILPVPTPLPTCRPDDSVTIQIGTAVAMPGSVVEVPVTLDTGGREIAGVQNDIVVDPLLQVVIKPNGRPDCTVNPDINKAATSFAMIPEVCTDDRLCSTRLRAIVVAIDNVDPIQDDSVLYTCRFSVQGGQVPLTLGCVEPRAATPLGDVVPSRCLDGHVFGGGPIVFPAD